MGGQVCKANLIYEEKSSKLTIRILFTIYYNLRPVFIKMMCF